MTRFILLELLGLFKIVRSALLPPSCRFSPPCTAFAGDAVRRFGPLRALPMILGRLSRCHPFHPGGFDPLPF